jgi:hypothetical protein
MKEEKVIINRVWAMPNKWTFRVKPIKKLIERYINDGKNWVDPFSGMSTMVEFTNDINSQTPAKSHIDAIDFLKQFKTESVDGVLLDPPYSLHQHQKAYGQNAKKFILLSPVYDEVARIVKPGGFAISFGWSSSCLSRKRGFKIVEILLVAHGGNHNDTIVTVEKKVQQKLVRKGS